MVGGGGQGGSPQGGGGGGGAVLYGQHIFIPQGVYSLSVASSSGTFMPAVVGFSTTGFGATVLGGGVGSSLTIGASSGGGRITTLTTTNIAPTPVGVSTIGDILRNATLYSGSVGGTGLVRPDANPQGQAGGGGGAGGVGSNGTLGTTATAHGGPGVLVNILDANHYWGGGGGGGSAITTPSNGGIGGGGAGSQRNGGNSGVTITYGTPGGSAYAAAVNSTGANGTGGGGGGGGGVGGIGSPGTGVGGSGIIILRYRSVRPSTSLTVGGDFKIQSKSGTVVEDKILVNSLTKSTTIEGNVLFNTNVNATNLTTSGVLSS